MIGYIYKITCNITNETYYGSTTQLLDKRKYRHTCKNNSYSSKQIIDRGDWNMIEVEKIEFNDKKELLFREQYYIDNFDCINIKNAILTEEQKKEYNIRTTNEWNKNNRDRMLNNKKEYYIKNKNYFNRKCCCIICKEELLVKGLKRHYKRKHT
tara:strand:- start:1015 stop:1476 length:462 start_codon:yes stop_codon:yes gene_type:complete